MTQKFTEALVIRFLTSCRDADSVLGADGGWYLYANSATLWTVIKNACSRGWSNRPRNKLSRSYPSY